MTGQTYVTHVRLHGNPSPSRTEAPIPDSEIPRPMYLEEGVVATQESQSTNVANETPMEIVGPSSIAVRQSERTTSEPADAQNTMGKESSGINK